MTHHRKLKVHEYHAITKWRVAGTREEVARITQRPEDLARWWPAAFLNAATSSSGDSSAPGSEFHCFVKGWLPYTLRFHGRVEDAVHGERFRVVVWGDFDGRMECEMQQDGPLCLIRFDWRVRVDKPIVRRLSFLFKIAFYLNHIWVMNRGLRSIKLELARMRALESGESLVAAPPAPTFPYGPRYAWLRKMWK